MKVKPQFDALITCHDGSKFAFISGQIERLRSGKAACEYPEQISLLGTNKGRRVLRVDATTWDVGKDALFRFVDHNWPTATVCYNGGTEFYLDS